MSDVPPPPPGFSLDSAPPPVRKRKGMMGNPRAPGTVTTPVDGDTFRTDNGTSVRLWGVDAPELAQPGFDAQGRPVPVGEQSRKALLDFVNGGPVAVGPPAGTSYGRTVAPVSLGGGDAGRQMVRTGNAFAVPDFVASNPTYRFNLLQDQRLASINRLGPVNRNFVQKPADYRREVKANPAFVVPRETVAQWWDTPTPFQGMPAEVEQGLTRLAYDLKTPIADVAKYAERHGFKVDPAQVQKSRDYFLKHGQKGGLEYLAPPPKALTDLSDGAGGAAVRGYGQGFLAGGLDEAGAAADSLLPYVPGLSTNGPRENVWNSDRRLADIWTNNEAQNASILGYDSFAHPYASTGAEVAGAITSGLVIPFGQGARTVPELARVGGVYGGLSGFFGTDGPLPQRLENGAIGVPLGMVTGAGLGKAVEVGAPYLGRAVGKVLGKGAQDAVRGTGESVATYVDDSAQNAAQGGSQAQSPDIAPPPPGFTVDAPHGRSVGMAAERPPSISGEVRQPDRIDVSPPAKPSRMDQPLTEAQRDALAQDIRPQDVLARPSNEVGSVEEAAQRDAGRYSPAKAPHERGAVSSGDVLNYSGQPVPKVGPVDLVGWLRLRGGLKPDEGGDLAAMGITNNAPRRGMDFVGQENRFGPMLNERGMNLDDAALAAWEQGYFPDHLDRPDVNTFLDALGETYNGGSGRRFLPEDRGQLEDYYGRQAERYSLEKLRAETGGPVVEDRSVPATEPQPFPPAEAYDDRLSETAKRAGNINLDKLETPQDIRRALVETERTVGFDAATRGKVTQAETERLASDLNMTPEQLLARRKGQALNAEEALAARQILAKSGNELVNLAKRVRSLEDPGDELLAQFRKAWLRHVAIQEQVSGATAEAGRALSQFRMAANSREVRGDVLSALVRGGGGKDNLQNAAGALLDAVESGPGVINTVAEKAAKPKFANKVMELYINSLLSGPQTHAVNIASNTLTAIAQIPEHAVGALIGGVRQLATARTLRQAVSNDAIDQITATEVGARTFGLLQGAKEGARLFAQALRRGEASDFASKVEGEQYKAVSGIKGEVARVPTRLLTAEDEFFKGIARRMELNAQAVRIARKEGLKGEEAKARIADLVANPTDEMFARALDYGRYLTFQRKLGPAGQDVSNFSQRHPLTKLFLPFVRTPTNLLKFAAERSPAAPLLKEWRADMMAGGSRRDMAIARSLLGTGFGAVIYEGALSGHVTGSAPTDPAKARLLYADGWAPYSIKLGNQYYSYKRLDPFSTTIGVAADLATLPAGMSEKQRSDKTTLLVASIMGNLASKTWLSGLSDLTDALTDPGRYAGNLKQRLVASFLVPNLATQIAHTADPVRRQRDSVGEEVRSRIPGLSQGLLPQRDIWGAPITNGENLGPDILSPVWVSKQLNDPVNRALLPLNYAPGYPSKTVGGRDLSPQEFDQYSEAAGHLSHERLSGLVAGPGWKSLDPEQQVKLAKKTVEQARDDVRAQMFGAGIGNGASDSNVSAPAGVIPPPPPGFAVDGEAGGRNVYAELQSAIPGVRFTSGFRTPAYQAQMRARGYNPASDSAHLSGSALDLLPPPGKSLSWLGQQILKAEPNARLLPEGDHLHATFPGYYGAPPLAGAVGAGLHNPLAGMPPPPPGFTIDAGR